MVSLLKLLIASYNYLGLLLHYNGKFNNTQKKLASQSRKATFSLKSKTSQLFLNFIQKRYCLDTYVSSILNYGCEIWGNYNVNDIEKSH